MAALLLFAALIPAPAFSLDSEDSRLFISGFSAYQRKDYAAAIEGLTAVLKNHPDTTLKDVALFWLARAQFKAGHHEQAGKQMAQFLREYPQSPLKGTVEEELLQLARGGGGSAAPETAPQKSDPAVADPNPLTSQQAEVTQTFDLEVAQYAELEVTLSPAPRTLEAGKPFAIAFDVVNTGNGNDSFRFESGFPAEYDLHFAAASAPETPVTGTPPLAVGEKFQVVAVGTIPRGNVDGQKNSFPIRIVSLLEQEVSQSKEVALVTSAPMLRTVLKAEKAKLLPGERVSYRISLLNAGSAPARALTLMLNHPPQYEPMEAPAAGFAQAPDGSLLLEGVQLKPGEGKDFSLTFRVRDEALAEQELFLRAEIANHDLKKRESAVSATSVVQRVSSVTAKIRMEKLVVVPGQALSVPVTVTNSGNIREAFSVKAAVEGAGSYGLFADLNRDGTKGANEPAVTQVGPLSPREEAHLLLQIETPPTAGDGTAAHAAVSLHPADPLGRSARVNLQIAYSRPVLELAMAAQRGKLKPGEVSSLELNCVNRGSNLAREVTVQSILPPQLELVAADPAVSRAENGVYVWRFDEMGAGEKRNIRMTYRMKPGIAVGTGMQVKNLLNYHDPLGNRY